MNGWMGKLTDELADRWMVVVKILYCCFNQLSECWKKGIVSKSDMMAPNLVQHNMDFLVSYAWKNNYQTRQKKSENRNTSS